ncbi:MAG: ImmA/IrrE family metallo-endopeptidase [Clostridia bacterium]|nr:ImmA/IrrE family metallo-endopeptidase [Clostridia bacterium]
MKQKILKTIENIYLRYGTLDPKQICDILNISITNTELPKGTNGFFFSIAGKKAIVINSALSKESEKYCLAHELGHALFHEQLNRAFLSQNTYFVAERYEREADLFAVCLLLGKPSKEKLVGIPLQLISKKFGLPIESVKDWAQMAS